MQGTFYSNSINILNAEFSQSPNITPLSYNEHTAYTHYNRFLIAFQRNNYRSKEKVIRRHSIKA